MTLNSLADVPQTQQERLAFIEFRSMFLGSMNRSDLVQRFGVSDSAASRDFALYRQLAPGNIHYDRSCAVYLASDVFSPLYSYAPEQVLTALAEGFGDNFVATLSPWLLSELPGRGNVPNVEIVIPVSRALYAGQALQIEYHSLSRGKSQKVILPLALVDNGLRWHLRAYEPAHERYADFVLNRIEQARPINGDVDQCLVRQQDSEWQQHVELELTPHPQLKHPETIAYEYRMVDQCLRMSVRLSLAGYLLRRWNVDCSADHRLKGPHYLLWLRNSVQLQQHDALYIAPGFMDLGQYRHTETTDAEA